MIFSFEKLTDNNFNLIRRVSNFSSTRLKGIINKLKLTNAANWGHKTNRMYEKTPQYSNQIKPKLKLDKLFFWNPSSNLIKITWNTKEKKEKLKTRQSVFDKRTQPKTPNKKEQKLNTKIDSTQKDGKTTLRQLA